MSRLPAGKPSILIVGTGAVASSLAPALINAGYPIAGIVSRQKKKAQQLAHAVQATHALTFSDDLSCDADLAFLCIPDDVIPQTAHTIAEMSVWQGKIVAHTSGALPADILAPLGAARMSFHPVQTFSRAAKTDFSGIYIGIEGDETAINAGIDIARDLGANELVLSAQDKSRYHLAAAIASNYTVTLMAIACDVLASIGIPRNEATALLRPLVTQTCTNVTTNVPERVLTGPASRGDIKTIKMHLDAIQHHLPHLDPIYRELLKLTLNVAKQDDRLSTDQVESLLKRIAAYPTTEG